MKLLLFYVSIIWDAAKESEFCLDKENRQIQSPESAGSQTVFPVCFNSLGLRVALGLTLTANKLGLENFNRAATCRESCYMDR